MNNFQPQGLFTAFPVLLTRFTLQEQFFLFFILRELKFLVVSNFCNFLLQQKNIGKKAYNIHKFSNLYSSYR